jgi:hypothetical protein
MQKILTMLILAAFSFPEKVFTAEIIGYPIAPVQARFYFFILGLLAVSAGMVSVAYLTFWVLDGKRKKAALNEISAGKEKAFGGTFSAAVQSAR